MLLRVKGVPLMYLPIIYYPIKRRRPGHRVPAADVRRVDAARAGNQQRVLLGDRPEPGRDVLSRLVHADRPGRRRRIPVCRRPGLVRQLPLLPSRSARGGVQQVRQRDASCRRSRPTRSAAAGNQAFGTAIRAASAHRLHVQPRHAAAVSAEFLSGVQRDANDRGRA